MSKRGCFICQPENPRASEEGCEDCEARWIAYYYEAYAPDGSSA